MVPNGLLLAHNTNVVEQRTREAVSADERRPLPHVRVAILVVAFSLAALAVGIYGKYARLVDDKLRYGVYSGTSDIYAARPPLLITNVSERNRESRRIVHFEEIPKVLVDAVISVEDKRFFRHQGIDLLRMIKAAYIDFREGRKDQGASTLSMQLVRSLLLPKDKSWKRKTAELLMALRLEQKLSKQQIFEYYCNQVYLGRRGTYNLHGFGAAAIAYFGKDMRELSLPEAATLAGLIQRPSYYHPLRNVDRLRERRNVVLSLMRQNGYITESQLRSASGEPVKIAPAGAQSSGAPYFIDLIGEELQRELGDRQAPRVYTTLDLNLQSAANDAVRTGMQNVDQRLRKIAGEDAASLPQAQVALVALDPRTGEVKALVGGRNYLDSQLDRALAERQPGSVFKPFVYAAALNTAIGSGSCLITPATLVLDQPTTFQVGNDFYEPENFGHTFYGNVTVREALVKSLNIPTVKLAKLAGYGAVADLARRAGLGENAQPTPSIALGAYEASPLDIAGAYTIFVNQGVYVRPSLISQVKTRTGQVTYSHRPWARQVLDPRVAYLMLNLLEDVLQRGTGAGVRTRGFTAPAAGKTGTSRDGWFAGFTSNLLCVVWVGFDDNRELGLEGAKSALPIWTEFMKRALQFAPYGNPEPFRPVEGISSAQIDPQTGMLATPNCPSRRTEFFVKGTEPTQECSVHGGLMVAPEPASAESR